MKDYKRLITGLRISAYVSFVSSFVFLALALISNDIILATAFPILLLFSMIIKGMGRYFESRQKDLIK